VTERTETGIASARDSVAKSHLPLMTLLWWVDGHEYLGRISLWHKLFGGIEDSGHVGYDIRPSARGRGHATAMLGPRCPNCGGWGLTQRRCPPMPTTSPAGA
jgi:predicted acetyltransferase